MVNLLEKLRLSFIVTVSSISNRICSGSYVENVKQLTHEKNVNTIHK